MKMRWILLSLSTVLTACTQQNWYHGAQSAQTANCMQQPISEYNDCNKQSQEMSYQEYVKNQEPLQKDLLEE